MNRVRAIKKYSEKLEFDRVREREREKLNNSLCHAQGYLRITSTGDLNT